MSVITVKKELNLEKKYLQGLNLYLKHKWEECFCLIRS